RLQPRAVELHAHLGQGHGRVAVGDVDGEVAVRARALAQLLARDPEGLAVGRRRRGGGGRRWRGGCCRRGRGLRLRRRGRGRRGRDGGRDGRGRGGGGRRRRRCGGAVVPAAP